MSRRPQRAAPVPPRLPPRAAPGEQDTLPVRYGWPVHLLSLAAFTLAFVGWLNETWLFLFDNPIWLNRYTEYAIIFAFGLWRIVAEKNAYTRRRLVILVAVVTGFWWLIPWLTPFFEPHIGFLWSQPVFPSLHVPGTLTFFLTLALVFLFGRRVICGFGCPCVGIRETVGFPFRARTLRSKWAWRLRHSKWLFFVYYAGVLVATQYPPNSWTLSFVGGFYLTVALTYFGSFFLAPIVGNRFYCRYLCPFGATFGLLNHAGFYDVKMDAARCIDCGRCEQACDMGIPVRTQGKAFGHVTGLEDCMGCARCVVSCPTNALEIRDLRNWLKPGLRQDASHLLRREAPLAVSTLAARTERAEEERLSPAAIRFQAARCHDCGEPACRAACPLNNRIPEWLALAAQGRFPQAAELMHATSPMPELCGALCPHDRLCEGACARVKQGQPAVAIGAIEHAVVEEALAQGWRPSLAPARYTGKTAAVVGAGPAGLAFADAMNRAGWRVTVLDRHSAGGGMLATGLPPFRIDKTALARRQGLLEAAGVRFELGVEVDAERFAALLDSHDGVFLGLGAHAPREVAIPGRDLAGVIDALDYLGQVNGIRANSSAPERLSLPAKARALEPFSLPFKGRVGVGMGLDSTAANPIPHLTSPLKGEEQERFSLPLKGEEQARSALEGEERAATSSPPDGRRVVVLGGGDSAMDCARAALRDGAGSVTIAYRGDSEQLRAGPHERTAAEQEGVRFLFRHVPDTIDGEAAVRAVHFRVGDAAETSRVDCDTVIVALGQRAAAPPWLARFGIEVDDGVVRVDADGHTTHPRVFAGGDCAHGPDLIVTAVAAGRRAATALLAPRNRWQAARKALSFVSFARRAA